MNAQTYNQVVNPVFAVLATPKHNTRDGRQQSKQRKKKPSTFDSLFSTACDNQDEMIIIHDTGCYGKDAKVVVGMVSSFNRAL